MTSRGLVVFAVALTALVFAGSRPQARPGSRRDGRISVIVGESGEVGPSPRLLVMDADGENRRRRLGYVVDASLSPDGRLIAYDALAERDARVIAADGRLRGRVLVRNGRHVDWSLDGGEIAFARWGRDSCSHADIWVENLHSGKQRRVVANADWPDWSPDGKRLAFVRLRSRRSCSSGSAGSEIWTVDLASRRQRPLIRSAGDPHWSPDGHRIAFTRWGSVDSFIYVARADGTAQRRVAEADSAAWSPDGSELAISNYRQITRMRLDGTHRRVVWKTKYGCPACEDLDWSR
jgi:Tol biopolymer transport system component